MPVLWMILIGVGGVVGFVGAVTLRKRWLNYPPPASLVTQPETDAAVMRLENGDVAISWQHDAAPVRIYAGVHPDAVNRELPIAEISEGKQTVLSGLNSADRHYFDLVFADGKRVPVAERILRIGGTPNFRDIGGYRTVDGRRVRWGRVYRSGTLHRLTEEDLRYLEQLQVRLICDLRTEDEMTSEPDRVPQGANYARLSVHSQRSKSESSRQLRALLFNPPHLGKLMFEAYTQTMLEENAQRIGGVLRSLAEPGNLPAIIHCTAGKDRTGIAIALLLLVLGVPEEVVIADYSLSNLFYEAVRDIVGQLVSPLMRLGVTIDDMYPLLIANPETLRATLAYLRGKYGSVEVYLRDKAGIGDEEIAQLKANLLE
jgi:protein-tyrosine phosphatase